MIHIPEENQHPNQDEVPYIDEMEPGAVIFDGCESAITGVSQNGIPIYDYTRLVDVFVQQGFTAEESIEWIDYNILPVQGGEGFIIHYY